MPRSNYLEDGYTESFYLEADTPPGLKRPINTEMRFEARPYTATELTKLAKTKNDGDELVQKICAGIAERFVSWDIVDKAGKSVPISAQAANKIKPTRLYRIWSCLCGNDAGDPDPNCPDAPQQTAAERREADAKN